MERVKIQKFVNANKFILFYCKYLKINVLY